MKKKIISFITAIILCIFLTISAFAYQGPAFVATDKLNVYERGGWNCKIIDTLPRWTNVTIEQDAGYGWYKINYDGKSGYVAGYYLLFGVAEQEPEAIQKVEPVQQKITSVEKSSVTGDGVRLRCGPSLNSDIIAELPRGTALTVRGTYGEWYEVSYNGTVGYMYGTYVNNKDTNIQAAASKSSGQAIVDTAMQYIGAPYRWGGQSIDKGFDCSGLVYAAYKENGITVNRVAQSMYQNGTSVLTNDLQLGDILYFGNSTSSIQHVGIYVGNGMMIHSSYGDTVRIVSLSEITMKLVGARRIIT